MSPAAHEAFTECGAFYRDAVLPPDVLSLYQVGVLFREPTFCDSTYKFGGLRSSASLSHHFGQRSLH